VEVNKRRVWKWMRESEVKRNHATSPRRSVTKLGRFAESRGNVVPHSIPPRTGAGANFNHLGRTFQISITRVTVPRFTRAWH
jgi:hypothetical protein